jgi:hypothetical protein
VKLSPAELSFALLLAASLSGKLLASGAAQPGPDQGSLNLRTADLLRAGGFTVTAEPHKFETLLRAERRGCRLLAGAYDPRGTFAEAFRQLAAPVGPLRFAYRGESYDRPPKLRPLLEYYSQRELRRIGLAPALTPIVAYAATPGCEVGAIAWQRLAVVPD